MVECDLAKVEVAGSNPVSRSKFPFARKSAEWAIDKWTVRALALTQETVENIYQLPSFFYG